MKISWRTIINIEIIVLVIPVTGLYIWLALFYSNIPAPLGSKFDPIQLKDQIIPSLLVISGIGLTALWLVCIKFKTYIIKKIPKIILIGLVIGCVSIAILLYSLKVAFIKEPSLVYFAVAPLITLVTVLSAIHFSKPNKSFKTAVQKTHSLDK